MLIFSDYKLLQSINCISKKKMHHEGEQKTYQYILLN